MVGARWLLAESGRPGKTAASLVIYMNWAGELDGLRMGRRMFRTTTYDWHRGPRLNRWSGYGSPHHNHDSGSHHEGVDHQGCGCGGTGRVQDGAMCRDFHSGGIFPLARLSIIVLE